MKKIKKLLFGVVGLLAIFAAAALAACSSGSHELISANETCISCHGENRSVYEVEVSNAEAVASTLTVNTSEDSVYVCTPLFPNEGDDSYYVCRISSTYTVSDGSVTIELGEGTWALAVGDEQSPTTMLVTVSADGVDSVTL